MTIETFTVAAISCGQCARTSETELKELEGVQSVNASVDTRKVEINFTPPASKEKIKALLTEIDYPAEGLIQL